MDLQLPPACRERREALQTVFTQGKKLKETMSDSIGTQNPSLDANRREIGCQRIAMDYKLMKALKSGNRNQLVEILPPEAAATNSTREEMRITISENDVSLLGVTAAGNTALHIAASHGHLELVEEICRRENSLLMMTNTKLDTPIHCAARAGDHQMVDRIIRMIMREVGEDDVNRVLGAKNIDGETALHEATQNGHSEVTQELMKHYPELASILNDVGISPLYYAVMSKSLDVVRALIKPSYEETATQISAAGPNGQTALHAAVSRSREIAQELLQWNPGLTKEVDTSGSTPLHYVASSHYQHALKLLLKYDISAAYLPDKGGSMPIHVAARVGNLSVIDELIKQCPDVDELLDNCNNNFLHVAVTNKKWRVVRYVCGSQRFEKLLNEKNYEGSTPLHLAVITGHQRIVGPLMQRKSVQTSMMDKMGFTPLDLLRKRSERGLRFTMNPITWIDRCLVAAGAASSPQRGDHFKYDNILDPEKETKKHLNVAQNVGIVSVLVATVTFAAAFTMPGGYKADDRPNPGAPVLARRYAFKVFILSDTVALVCSMMATLWVIYAGSLAVDSQIRIRYLNKATDSLSIAAVNMIIAFNLGIYVVLSPITKWISIIVFVMTSATSVFVDIHMSQLLRLGLTLRRRLGWRYMLWRVRRLVVRLCIIPVVYVLVSYGFIFLLALL